MSGADASVDVLAAARGFQKELRERADEIEKNRRMPRDLARRFGEAGFYRTCVPEAYGGLELPPAATMEMIETLARADGSAAWCVFIGSTSGTVLALLPPDAAREVFHRPDVLLGGVFAPRGKAVATAGGFTVNGHWQWGSGTENADWVMGGCQVVRNGEVERMKSGAPRSRMMIAPRSEIEFLDTWQVSGLCGTGSTDFVMKDLFVPESRSGGIGSDGPLARPLYCFPQFGLLAMGIAAVSMGLARAAIDELVEVAAGKTPSGSSRTLAERPASQSEVSKAEAALRSVRAYYYEVIEEAWQAAREHGAISVEHRRDVRLATTWATRQCAGAVDRMYHLAGGTSIYRASPLQRIFRDVHVATQHMMVSPPTLELTGRLFLGLETDTSLL